MQLTALETLLGTSIVALLSSGVTGVLIRLLLGRRLVTKEECLQNHKNAEDLHILSQSQRDKDMQELKGSIRVLFRMNRALITYSDIPPEEKERILNTNGG